jgi:hypothetical protein
VVAVRQIGSVKVYQPSFTRPDPSDSTKRMLLTSPNYAWRFRYRSRTYQESGYPTAREARAAGEKRKGEVVAGLEQDPRKLTFEGLKQIGLAELTAKGASTQASGKAVWKRLATVFAPSELAFDIRRSRLLEYVEIRKSQGAAPNTIKLDLQYLRNAMGIAHQDGRMLAIPAFPRLKRTRREQFFRADELELLYRELAEWWVPYYRTAEETGWRARSELKTRQWPHVDFGPATWPCRCRGVAPIRNDDRCPECGALRPGWIQLEATASKTGERRMFPMTLRLRRILVEQRRHVEALQQQLGRVIPWLFCRPDGSPLGDERKAWQNALRRAGFGKLDGRSGPWSSAKVPHDIRRTAIMRSEEMGLPRNASMAMVGHGEERTFSGYAVATPDALMRAAEQIEAKRAEEESSEPKVVQLELWASKRRS